MRKIFIAFIALLLVVLTVSVVFAANSVEFTLKATKQTVVPGDEIVITLDVASEGTCSAMGFVPEIDTQRFEIVSGKCLVEDAALSDFSRTDGAAVLFEEPGSFKGALCQFTLRVKADAVTGIVEISGKTAAKNGAEFLDVQLKTVQIQVEGKEVEEVDPEVTEQQTVATESTSAPDASNDAVKPSDTQDDKLLIATAPEVLQEPVPTTGTQQPADEPFPWEILVISVALVAVAAVAILLMNKKKK